MLPLPRRELPGNREELQAALTDGLRLLFDLPANQTRVAIEEAGYPALARLRMYLTGAVARRDYRTAPLVAGSRPGLTVAQFEVVGQPVYFEQTAIFVRLSGQEVHLEIAQDERGRMVLTVSGRAHRARPGKCSPSP